MQCNRCLVAEHAPEAEPWRRHLFRLFFVAALITLLVGAWPAADTQPATPTVAPNIRPVDRALIESRTRDGRLSEHPAMYWHEVRER